MFSHGINVLFWNMWFKNKLNIWPIFILIQNMPRAAVLIQSFQVNNPSISCNSRNCCNNYIHIRWIWHINQTARSWKTSGPLTYIKEHVNVFDNLLQKTWSSDLIWGFLACVLVWCRAESCIFCAITHCLGFLISSSLYRIFYLILRIEAEIRRIWHYYQVSCLRGEWTAKLNFFFHTLSLGGLSNTLIGL